MRPLRVGLLGAGRIGARHARTLAQEGVVLTVADIDMDVARRVAEPLGAAVAEPDRLFDDGLDALVIAAPTHTHAELVVRAAEAGLTTFCEKPLAPDVELTADVVQRVRAAGGSVQVGFQRRFDAGYRRVAAAVGSGELGVVHTVRANTSDPEPPPAAYVAVSGGLFHDCSIHDFDAIRFVTGREVRSAYALGGNTGDAYIAAAGDVDTGAVLLELDDGAIAVASASRYNGGAYDVRIEVAGNRGTIAAGLGDRAGLRSVEPGARWPDGPPHPDFRSRFAAAYAAEMRAFLEHAAGRLANPCPPEDALAAVRIAEAAQRSLREGRPVALDEIAAPVPRP